MTKIAFVTGDAEFLDLKVREEAQFERAFARIMAGRMWRRQPPCIREFHPARG